MGATGSGKTSIINLLGRFYECQSGAVMIDGIDVKDYKLKQLRRQLGIVPQETFLFSDSLEGNIAFGNPDLGQDDIIQAAQIAQAQEFVDNLDQGYDTVVGERGMGLSGGQKQRIAIARAIALNPKILVFDDSTSAVDLETEAAIQSELKRVLKNRTTFIISHRISSVKNADEIIVLDHGSIAERGTHEQLMAKKGLYYGIFMDQYRDYQSILGEGTVKANA
jgi:ATP-binding cassette subfamily B multidrug efflux pump